MGTRGKAVLGMIVLGLGGLGGGALANAIAHGDPVWFAFILLAVPLLALGAVVVLAASRFVPGWRAGGENAKGFFAVVVAVVAGAGLYAGMTQAVPVQRPEASITAALAPVCDGIGVSGAATAATSGTPNHLVVLASTGAEHGWTSYAPVAWRPQTLDDAELVACISADEISAVVEVCSYSNGPDVTRHSARREVAVMDARTGQRVARFSITREPRACAATEEVELTELRGTLDWPIVEEHLAGLVATGTFIDPDGARPAETAVPSAAASTLEPSGAGQTSGSAPIASWSDDASEHRSMNGQRFGYVCPPGGAAGDVWGTDTYTDDSSVCTAAVHAGAITIEGGGGITIEIEPGLSAYTGSERNGIWSDDWGAWEGSFAVVTAE